MVPIGLWDHHREVWQRHPRNVQSLYEGPNILPAFSPACNKSICHTWIIDQQRIEYCWMTVIVLWCCLPSLFCCLLVVGFFSLSEVPVKCLNDCTSFLFVLSFWQPSWVFHDQGLCQDIINPPCVSRAVVWLFPSPLRGDGLQPYQWLREKITSEDGRKQQAKLKELTHIAEKLGCTLPQLAIGRRKQNEPRGKTHITQHIVNVTATVSLLATVSLMLWRSRGCRSSSVHLKQQMYISLCDFGCVCLCLALGSVCIRPFCFRCYYFMTFFYSFDSRFSWQPFASWPFTHFFHFNIHRD